MISFFGIIATIMFISASAFQAFKSMMDGHSNGISKGFIWNLIIGYILMLTYVTFKIKDTVLLFSLIGQLSMIIIIAKYKYFPIDKIK